MSSWDHMDNKVWESSEVMKELEKIYKKADLSQQVQKATQQLGSATKQVEGLNSAVSKLNTSMKNLGKADDALPEELKEKKKKKKKSKAKKISKAELFQELSTLSQQAIDDMNYKLAYKVAKALESIKSEE